MIDLMKYGKEIGKNIVLNGSVVASLCWFAHSITKITVMQGFGFGATAGIISALTLPLFSKTVSLPSTALSLSIALGGVAATATFGFVATPLTLSSAAFCTSALLVINISIYVFERYNKTTKTTTTFKVVPKKPVPINPSNHSSIPSKSAPQINEEYLRIARGNLDISTQQLTHLITNLRDFLKKPSTRALHQCNDGISIEIRDFVIREIFLDDYSSEKYLLTILQYLVLSGEIAAYSDQTCSPHYSTVYLTEPNNLTDHNSKIFYTKEKILAFDGKSRALAQFQSSPEFNEDEKKICAKITTDLLLWHKSQFYTPPPHKATKVYSVGHDCHILVSKVLDFLVEKNLINSWNWRLEPASLNKNLYYVKLDAHDETETTFSWQLPQWKGLETNS